MASLKKELHVLSTECWKAFAAAGLEDSDHPQIKRTLELCSSYISSSTRAKTDVCAIGTLWKEDGHEQEAPVDKKELATSILGEDLVATLVEKNRQPPDVSKENLAL